MLIRVCCAMGLTEGVATGNQRHRLLIIHRHAPEGLADVNRGRGRIRVTVWPLRVHINQAHLNRPKRFLQIPLTGITLVP